MIQLTKTVDGRNNRANANSCFMVIQNGSDNFTKKKRHLSLTSVRGGPRQHRWHRSLPS